MRGALEGAVGDRDGEFPAPFEALYRAVEVSPLPQIETSAQDDP